LTIFQVINYYYQNWENSLMITTFRNADITFFWYIRGKYHQNFRKLYCPFLQPLLISSWLCTHKNLHGAKIWQTTIQQQAVWPNITWNTLEKEPSNFINKVGKFTHTQRSPCIYANQNFLWQIVLALYPDASGLSSENFNYVLQLNPPSKLTVLLLEKSSMSLVVSEKKNHIERNGCCLQTCLI